MNKARLTILGLLLLLLSLVIVAVGAGSPATAAIRRSLFAGSGGPVSGSTVLINGSLGQAVAGTSFGTTTQLRSGYWQLLSAPVLGVFGKSSPADKATGQPISVDLSWGSSANADGYEYCLDSSNDNACQGDNWLSTATTGATAGGLVNNTTYYWQVRSVSNPYLADANNGVWWSFTTIDAGYLNLLPLVVRNFCGGYSGPGEQEDNDRLDQANGPLCPGYHYQGGIYDDNENEPGENTEDWFYVDWNGAGTISIRVSSFPTKAQVRLYNDTNLQESLADDTNQADGIYELNYAGGAVSSRYYIRLFVPGIDRPDGAPDYELSISFN